MDKPDIKSQRSIMKINYKGIDFIDFIKKDATMALFVYGPVMIASLLMITLGYNAVGAYIIGIPSIFLVLFVLCYMPLVSRKKLMYSLVTEITVEAEYIELKVENYLTRRARTFRISIKNIKLDSECSFPLYPAKKAYKITELGPVKRDFYLVWDFYNMKGDDQRFDEMISLIKSNISK